jgi:hypothetical protein
MTLKTKHYLQITAVAGTLVVAMLSAPEAAADTNPSVPNDPTGQIYSPPGYIGYYPGAYGFQTVLSLTPPSRLVDSGGTAARSNADPKSSHAGMPGDKLGVQTNHVVVKPQGDGPRGQQYGVRTPEPMQLTADPDISGGVMPGQTSAMGRRNPATGQATGLEDPNPGEKGPKRPPAGSESRQPAMSGLAAPNTTN